MNGDITIVIPANAGIHPAFVQGTDVLWIPAFAGMTARAVKPLQSKPFHPAPVQGPFSALTLETSVIWR